MEWLWKATTSVANPMMALTRSLSCTHLSQHPGPQQLNEPPHFLWHCNGIVRCSWLMLGFSQNLDFGLSKPSKVFSLHFLNTHIFSLWTSFDTLWQVCSMLLPWAFTVLKHCLSQRDYEVGAFVHARSVVVRLLSEYSNHLMEDIFSFFSPHTFYSITSLCIQVQYSVGNCKPLIRIGTATHLWVCLLLHSCKPS